jgi:hypothetical protein
LSVPNVAPVESFVQEASIALPTVVLFVPVVTTVNVTAEVGQDDEAVTLALVSACEPLRFNVNVDGILTVCGMLIVRVALVVLLAVYVTLEVDGARAIALIVVVVETAIGVE